MHPKRIDAHGATALPPRFLAKYAEEDNGCWNWTATRDAQGYGHIRWHGRVVLAHRLAYTILVGDIPDRLQVDHLCRNTSCVNPVHMEIVTCKVNVRRSNNACAIHGRKTHCKRGHEFTPENTYIDPKGSRACRTCMRALAVAWRQRRRDAGWRSTNNGWRPPAS